MVAIRKERHVAPHLGAPFAVERAQAVQRATGMCYLLGAFLWITNAAWSGWPSGHEVLDAYVLGVSAVLGATLFHIGAMCQLWDSLNSQDIPVAFTRLPTSAREPWLEPQLHSSPPSLPQTSKSPVQTLGPDSMQQTSKQTPTACVSSTSCQQGTLYMVEELQFDPSISIAKASQLQESPNSMHHDAHALPSNPEQCWLPSRSDSMEQQHGAGQRSEEDDAEEGPTLAGDSPRSVFSIQHPTEDSHQDTPPCQTTLHDPFSHVVLPAQQQQHCGSTLRASGQRAALRTRSCPGSSVGLRSPRIHAIGHDYRAKQQGSWVWWAWRPHDLNFVAAFIQVVGTTIFAAACLCGFPGVLPTNYAQGDWVLWDVFFWSPFLLGSCLFITSALLSLRECQGSWCSPQPCCRVWWVHLANTIGSIGFWLCSFFGFFAYPAQRYQRWGTAFSCLWGSCCFAVAAYLHLLEACC